ncbi:MAG: ribosome maturation factor RimM [Pseudomonadota bacterium]
MASAGQEETIVVGRISGAYGIKGWVKVYSYTDPPEGIFGYSPWRLTRGNQTQTLKIESGRTQGKGLIALPEGYTDRNQAELLIGSEISVGLEQLPDLTQGDYYWFQLQGLRVINTRDEVLGVIDHLLETGANDVMVIHPSAESVDDKKRLVPFVEEEIVKQVDLDGQRIVVSWEKDF